MPGHKKYGPLEDKLKQAVAAEIAKLVEEGKSPEQARAILLDMKAKQQLSLRAMKDGTTFRLLKSTKAKQLFREALSDAQPFLNKVSSKDTLWYNRVLKALPEKAKEHGTKRKRRQRLLQIMQRVHRYKPSNSWKGCMKSLMKRILHPFC
jgi:hypothetical protein